MKRFLLTLFCLLPSVSSIAHLAKPDTRTVFIHADEHSWKELGKAFFLGLDSESQKEILAIQLVNSNLSFSGIYGKATYTPMDTGEATCGFKGIIAMRNKNDKKDENNRFDDTLTTNLKLLPISESHGKDSIDRCLGYFNYVNDN